MVPDVDEFLAPFRKGKGFNISGAMRNACRQVGVPLTYTQGQGQYYVPNPRPLRDVWSASHFHAMWFKPHEYNAGSYVFLVEWRKPGGRETPWQALMVPYATFHDTCRLRTTVAWILGRRVKYAIERVNDGDLDLCPLSYLGLDPDQVALLVSDEGGAFEVYPLGVEGDGRRSGPERLINYPPGTSPPRTRTWIEIVPLTSPRVKDLLTPSSYRALVRDIRQGAADLSKIVPPPTVGTAGQRRRHVTVLTTILGKLTEGRLKNDVLFCNLLHVAANAGIQDDELCGRLRLTPHRLSDWRDGRDLPTLARRKRVLLILQELDSPNTQKQGSLDPKSCWDRLLEEDLV